MNSLAVDMFYFGMSTSLPARFNFNSLLQRLTLTLTPSFSYTFYEHVDRRFKNKDNTDQTQEGSLHSPITLSLSLSASYKILDSLSISTNYSLNGSATYENNDGNRYWRNYSSFFLGASYSYNKMVNFGIQYIYGADPVSPAGNIRVPFFTSFADWNNAGKIYFSFYGSYDII